MKAFFFYLLLPLFYLISLLPFFAMYLLSDFLFFILYYFIGYRKKVVYKNLKMSFPEKSEAEIIHIQKKYYKHLCDLTLETFKTLSISKSSIRKHVLFKDSPVLEKYFSKKQSIIIVLGHMGNWELAGARFGLEKFHQLYVLYHPLSNKQFDKLMIFMRTRLGNKLYAMNDALRGMISNKETLTATAFIADQTPSPRNAYWTNFLNQDTPVFIGTEKIARKMNYPVIYISIRKEKRGKYIMSAEELSANPKETKEHEITEMFVNKLEAEIREQPYIWLWSHRRWKHKRL